MRRAYTTVLDERGDTPVDLEITLFGSQRYGQATGTSDYDFALRLWKDRAPHAKALRHELRYLLIGEGRTKQNKCRDVEANDT